MEEFASKHATSLASYNYLKGLGYDIEPPPHLQVPPTTRHANFQHEGRDKDKDKDKPSSSSPSSSSKSATTSAMTQKLVDSLDQLKALEETKTKKAQEGSRTLNQEYKTLKRRTAGGRRSLKCKGPGICKNKLCEHLLATAPPLNETQNRILDIVMKRTADDGFGCDRKYAEDWFKRSGEKLVPTLISIKGDIERREDRLRNSGRFRLHPTQSVQSLPLHHSSASPVSSSRAEILYQIETEDDVLKTCLSKKSASPVAREIYKRHSHIQDREAEFAGYVGEANFRAARSSYWRECKKKGFEGDELFERMDAWELEHDDDPEFQAPGWRYPFADDTKDVAEAQVPHQATVEDAEDEDGHDDDNVGGNKIMDNEATLVIQHVARRLLSNELNAIDILLSSLFVCIHKGIFYSEDILGDPLITDEDAVFINKSSTTHDEKLLRVWRRIQESEFPEIAQDDIRVETIFTALREWLLKMYSQDEFRKAMMESYISLQEVEAFLGPHSSPAQKKLLFIQRYYHLLPPESVDDVLTLKYQLETVDGELQTEFRDGEIKYHDPSMYMPPRDRIIVDQHFRHAGLALTAERINDVMTGGILTKGLAEKILGPDANEKQQKILFWARYLEKYPELTAEQLKGVETRIYVLTKQSNEIKYLENLAMQFPTSSEEYSHLQTFIRNLPNNPSTVRIMYRKLRNNMESPESARALGNRAQEKLLAELTLLESTFERDHETILEIADDINDMIYAIANRFSIIDDETKQCKEFDSGKYLWDKFESDDGVGLMAFDEAFDQYATAKVMQALATRSAVKIEEVQLLTAGLVTGFELLYPEEALVKGHIELAVEIKDISTPETTVHGVDITSSPQKNFGDSNDKDDVEDMGVMTPESSSDQVDVTSAGQRNSGEPSDEDGVDKTKNKGKGFIKTVRNAKDTLFKMMATKNIDKKFKKLNKLEAKGVGSKTAAINSFDAQVVCGVSATSQSDLEGINETDDQAGFDITEGDSSDDEDGEDDEDEDEDDKESAERNLAVVDTNDNKKEPLAKEGVKSGIRMGAKDVKDFKGKGRAKDVTTSEKGAEPKEIDAIQASDYEGIKTPPRGRFRDMNATQIAALVNKDLDAHTMKLDPILRVFFTHFLKLHAAITVDDVLSKGPFKSEQIAYFMTKTRANSFYTAINLLGICGNRAEEAIALYLYMTAYLEQYFRRVGVKMERAKEGEGEVDMQVTQQMVEIKVWQFAEYVWERRGIMVEPYVY